MNRFLTNLILIISILSILVIPSFAATTSDSDDIVILKQPTDTIARYNNDMYTAIFDVTVLGDVVSYQWQYSFDQISWTNEGLNSPVYTIQRRYDQANLFVRCRITGLDGSIIFTRVAICEFDPVNIFNFIGSCLRYITSYISLIINSLVTPGASLYPLLPVLCIGIAVAALLIVIKITKGFSWGM